jgi:hypothetical protein
MLAIVAKPPRRRAFRHERPEHNRFGWAGLFAWFASARRVTVTLRRRKVAVANRCNTGLGVRLFRYCPNRRGFLAYQASFIVRGENIGYWRVGARGSSTLITVLMLAVCN